MEQHDGRVRTAPSGLEQISGQPRMVVFALEVDGLDVGCAANRRGRHPEGQKQLAHTGTHFTTEAPVRAIQAASRTVETTPTVEGSGTPVMRATSRNWCVMRPHRG